LRTRRLAVDPGQGSPRDFQVGPQRQGRFVLPACQLSLAGGGEHEAKVGAADRVAIGLAQERKG
jgi:hypothetical protein